MSTASEFMLTKSGYINFCHESLKPSLGPTRNDVTWGPYLIDGGVKCDGTYTKHVSLGILYGF